MTLWILGGCSRAGWAATFVDKWVEEHGKFGCHWGRGLRAVGNADLKLEMLFSETSYETAQFQGEKNVRWTI